MLDSSLENQIKPTFDFLKGYVRANETLILAVKQSIRVRLCNVQKVMVPNIDTLWAHGVPKFHIEKLIMMQLRALMLGVDVFKNVTDAIKEMGFDPKSQSWAITSMSMNTKHNWEKKKEAFMSFGWSESTFLRLIFMLGSEKKIRELMDFLVNKAGLGASENAKCPNLIRNNLRRINPRCSVLQVLMSKGLIGKEVNVLCALDCGKKRFETRFLTSIRR
ncbi:uncharacterized protein LOC132277538 [Cornus florida]|uniref:uncharacterized protein LOC132277538 n=1 Tax=Cornus florida TaxID=4283 RepID=UPI002899F4B0|nr:uncharacterized protein LOC132277538 [Cornus florida]